MSEFSVGLGGLAAFVDALIRFDAVAARLEHDLDEQARRVATEWTGQAAAAHRAAHRDCRRDLARARGVSVQLRTVVATAHANYAAALDANARMWALR